MFDPAACEYKDKIGIVYLNFLNRGIVCATEESSLLSKFPFIIDILEVSEKK